MPTLAEWLKLLHVVSGFWLVTGLVGRDVTIARARRSREIREVATLLDLAGRFDATMVQPATFVVLGAGLLTMWKEHIPLTSGSYWLVTALAVFVSVFLLVPAVFIPRGKAFGAAFEAAKREGEVTAELRAAFHDTVVAVARGYEALAVAFVIALMVLKPF